MAKRIRRRNSRGSGFLLLIIFLALAVAGGFFYASGKDTAKKNSDDGKQKVQSADLDLRGRSKSAHEALDNIFATKKSNYGKRNKIQSGVSRHVAIEWQVPTPFRSTS